LLQTSIIRRDESLNEDSNLFRVSNEKDSYDECSNDNYDRKLKTNKHDNDEIRIPQDFRNFINAIKEKGKFTSRIN
jgi:hypothetical protein